MDDLHKLGEFGVIDLFFQKDSSHAWVKRSIGDDCAVLSIDERECLLITTDSLVERIHFQRDKTSADQLGYKSLAVSLSDIAAMGGEPKAATVAISVNPSMEVRWIERFRDGLLECARQYKVDIIGGDTVAAQRDMSFCLTLIGKAKTNEIILRTGARDRDGIFLGRPVGDSAAGLQLLLRDEDRWRNRDEYHPLLLAHNRPVPQIELGRFLATSGLASAMIDVSDGLLQDLQHICQQSKVGAKLKGDEIPISEPAKKLARQMGLSASDWALNGGEDYCLLFCVPAEKKVECVQRCRSALGIELFPIGEIVSSPTISIQRAGAWSEAVVTGYDHFSLR